MTETDSGMLDRMKNLEEQVRKLTHLIEVMSRYDDKDEALTETRLNDDKAKKIPAAVSTGEYAAEYEPSEEYYATLGRLTLGIAHDVNNLLNIMVGYCELLGEGLPEADPRREFAAAVADLGQQAGEMLHYLTDRADVRRTDDYDRVVVAELFDKLRRLLPRYVGANRRVEVECEGASATMPLERMQAIRLVLNLVGNARAATPPDGRIEVKSRQEAVDAKRAGYPDTIPTGRYAVLNVSDSGDGMSEEVLRRMFQMHYTTRGGGGIGLSVVRGIVRDAGGFIQVESAPGVGTQMRVFLPV